MLLRIDTMAVKIKTNVEKSRLFLTFLLDLECLNKHHEIKYINKCCLQLNIVFLWNRKYYDYL
jgi:hypothetical protein